MERGVNAVYGDTYTRPSSLGHFGSDVPEERFDISPRDIGPGRLGKDRFQGGVRFTHDGMISLYDMRRNVRWPVVMAWNDSTCVTVALAWSYVDHDDGMVARKASTDSASSTAFLLKRAAAQLPHRLRRSVAHARFHESARVRSSHAH